MDLSWWMAWIIWSQYMTTVIAQVENGGICELLKTIHFGSVDIFTTSMVPKECIKLHRFQFRSGILCPHGRNMVPILVPTGHDLRTLLDKCSTVGTQGIVLVQVNKFEDLMASRVDQQIYFLFHDAVYEFYQLDRGPVLRKLTTGPPFHSKTFSVGDFLERRSNLWGQTLKVLVEQKAPFLLINRTRVPPPQQERQRRNGMRYIVEVDPETLNGIYPRLLQVMSEQLNVSLQFYRHIQHDWGVWNTSSKQWTGGLGCLYHGQVDLIGTSLTMTMERAKQFQFLPPIGKSHDAIFIRNQLQHLKDWDLFFRPFTPSLWRFLSFITIFFTALVAFIQYFYERSQQTKAIWVHLLEVLEIYWILFSSYFGKPPPPTHQIVWRPRRYALEVFLFSIFLVGNIIFMTFRASLTSELSVGKVKMPFSHPDELLSTEYRMIVKGGGATEDKLATAPTDSVYAKLFRAYIEPNPTAAIYRSTSEALMALTAETDVPKALFYQTTTVYNYQEYRCEIITAWQSSTPVFNSMAFQQNSPYRPFMKRSLLKIRESGVMDMIIQDCIQSDKARQSSCRQDRLEPLGEEKLGPLFVLLIAAFCFAIIMAFLEHVSFFWRGPSRIHIVQDSAINSKKLASLTETWHPDNLQTLIDELERVVDHIKTQ